MTRRATRSGRATPRRVKKRPVRNSPLRGLAALEACSHEFGGDAANRKLAALARLEGGALPNLGAVRRLHEALCFLRAYPDSREVEARVTRMLAGFSRRRDLARFRARLTDSGIAGTAIRFRFFSAMAVWLAKRWPARLEIDWRQFDSRDRLETLLPLLALAAEQPGLDEYDLGLRGWLAEMRGAENEAAFLIRRFHALAASAEVIERLWDELDPPMTLRPLEGTAGNPATPSRTLAFHARAPRALQRQPFSRVRPDLRLELARSPAVVRSCAPGEATEILDLARAAMVTRSRDLDAFSYGDPADVRVMDWGDGLAFACIGVIPERRLLLEAVYAFLTLRNGVPIGYVLNSALYGSAEIAYNVFETYRGAEAGAVYAKALAMVRHLFGAETFTIFPYQLGDGNDEAIESGAWWFYRKFGFAPRDAATRRLMRTEESRMAKRAKHRSTPAALRRLARENLYFSLGPERDDVVGELPIPSVGLAVTRFLAANWGGDRERAERECSFEAARMLGIEARRSRAGAAGRERAGVPAWTAATAAPAGWSSGERLAWRRWAPLVCILPGVADWSAADRAALAAVIRAKGARRESDFVRAFDAHSNLRAAVRAVAVGTRTEPARARVVDDPSLAP
ncbi:MAG: hypothetical protein ABIS67_06725 [Candidatus Eisenbacteria bacterium]